MATRNHAGGAAAAGGFDFQHRVATWIAVHVLAEKAASVPWELPANLTLDQLGCETGHPVDDIHVINSSEGLAFIQVKRSISLSEREDSELASVLDQFVRQFIACQKETGCPFSTARPLDPLRDRFVLATAPASPQTISVHLPRLLRKIRNLPYQQAYEDASTNKTEQRALSIITGHIRRLWRARTGLDPSDADIRLILSLVHVQVLDLDAGGRDERTAKTLLRSAVLRNPDQADAAWSSLIATCAQLASVRSGTDRVALQRILSNSGFDLKTTRSYEGDVERLRAHSRHTLDALAQHAQIRIGEQTLHIHRACTGALIEAAQHSSLVVVGEPGSGKTGALSDLVRALDEAGEDYVLLATDQLASRSLGELRGELGLEHVFIEVLNNWPGTRPAYLVIDALDASRNSTGGQAVRDLIQHVMNNEERWHVIVSIRKYDLRNGHEIKRLFTGGLPTKCNDPEFTNVRHISIPELSDLELEHLTSDFPELQSLLENAPEDLQKLLRSPFNLQLLGELLSEGISVGALAPIKTQVQLLDRYWQHRIIRSDGLGDAREAVLRKLCETMVENRSLRAKRRAVSEPNMSQPLNDLLSGRVLVEWQPTDKGQPDRYTLAFSHHVLFDYAVARLLFFGDLDNLPRYLASSPDLVMLVRPSVVFHFKHLWYGDPGRREFWELVYQVIQAEGTPRIGKLIGPTTAVELAQSMNDLHPLCEGLGSVEIRMREQAEQALRYLAGALNALSEVEGFLKLSAGPWARLLDCVSAEHLRKTTVHIVRHLLMTLCKNLQSLTSEQNADIGRAARRLLELAWSVEPRNLWLVANALECVCQTFDSDTVASAMLIRHAIEPQHLAQFGFEELPVIARNLKSIFQHDPILVADIYRAAFHHKDESDETTFLGSHILPLTSSRRQDYDLALYELAETFPEFLRAAPEEAVLSLLAVLEAYVIRRHSVPRNDLQEKTFEFSGYSASLRQDYSSIWDEGNTYAHDKPLKMLDDLQSFLEELAATKEYRDLLRRLMRIIVSENRLAVIWRRLLIAGSRHPQSLGQEVLPLAYATPVLLSMDTTAVAGEYLKAVFPLLTPEQRQEIEETLLHLPKTVPPERREAAERTRDRLIGNLPDEQLVTPKARRRLQALREFNDVSADDPPRVIKRLESRPYGEKEYLKEQGVPVEDDANRNIQELQRPVKVLIDNKNHAPASIEEATALLPALRSLHTALVRADEDGVHPMQKDYAWGTLAEACARVASAKGFSCATVLGEFVRRVLLEASRYPVPVPEPQDNDRFEELPSWGSPAARVDAAEGLIQLVRQRGCASPEVLEVIESLSADPVPAVRYQIAAGLNVLYSTNPELMWRMLDKAARKEESRGVLQGLLAGPLNRLAEVETERVAELTETIFNRVRGGPGAGKVREFSIQILAGTYVWHNNSRAEKVILAIASNPAAFPEEAGHMLSALSPALAYNSAAIPQSEARGVRQRVLDVLLQLLRSTQEVLYKIEEMHVGVAFDQWPAEDLRIAKSQMQLIDHIGSELYFASGAHETRGAALGSRIREIDPQAERFYHEAGLIFDALAQTAYPSVAHHLVEALVQFIPIDPCGVFLRIHQVILSAQRTGYQFERMAADLLVRIVEYYFAEYRKLLQQNIECRKALIEVLDVFVEVGWPSTLRLIYRLDEIYR